MDGKENDVCSKDKLHRYQNPKLMDKYVMTVARRPVDAIVAIVSISHQICGVKFDLSAGVPNKKTLVNQFLLRTGIQGPG